MENKSTICGQKSVGYISINQAKPHFISAYGNNVLKVIFSSNYYSVISLSDICSGGVRNKNSFSLNKN